MNESINQILIENAESMEAASVAFVDDLNYWIIVFEEEMPLFLNPTEREHHWVLAGPICDPPSIDTARFFDLVMVYNGQPELSGGFRIGLDEPDGMLKLSVDLGSADLAQDRFLALSSEFRRCRLTWEGLAENWQPADTAGPGDEARLPPGAHV